MTKLFFFFAEAMRYALLILIVELAGYIVFYVFQVPEDIKKDYRTVIKWTISGFSISFILTVMLSVFVQKRV